MNFFEYKYQLSAQKYGQYGPGITTPDMDDVKESVKQGVSKVAGRLSGMASGVMTQLQVRYKHFERYKILYPLRLLELPFIIIRSS